MKDMDQWFLSIASAVLDSGQIGPPKAVMKRLNQVATDIGWGRMKQAAEDMGLQEVVAAMNKAEALAADSPGGTSTRAADPRILPVGLRRGTRTLWVGSRTLGSAESPGGTRSLPAG